MKKAFIAFMTTVLCFGMMIPSVAFANETIDAHFYVRYDSSNQAEDGTTHYNPTNYFPIGEVADGYEYGSNHSDTSSVDGQVYSNTAYVEGAEGVVTEGNVNLYHSFNATSETVKDYFAPVYDNIAQGPSKNTISASINAALGTSWQEAYDAGKVDALWYVTKLENDGTHVDGCLYWLSNGSVINKDKDVDENGEVVDPGIDEPIVIPDPEPAPEPTPEPDVNPTPIPDPTPEPTPDPTPTPEVNPKPGTPEVIEPDVPNTDKIDTIIPEESDKEGTEDKTDIGSAKGEEKSQTALEPKQNEIDNQNIQETIKDNETPLAAKAINNDINNGDNQMPRTNDITRDDISLMGMIATMSLIIIVLSAYRRNGYEKVSKKQ